jgi:Ni,Fe-hydrogenase III small subunit
MFLVLLLVGCTTSTVQQQIQDAVKWYQSNAKPQKALAYGATRSGGGVFGYAEGMPDLESARRKAIANCNENGFKANVAVSCVVIYENDDFVGSRSPIL